ncbi:hypothetical protein CDD83_9279 [Cordyceps sp. RAO-2017]|nr:hypothetical protein CDD83_9279 [Cordyceps sp. RAO-2017]
MATTSSRQRPIAQGDVPDSPLPPAAADRRRRRPLTRRRRRDQPDRPARPDGAEQQQREEEPAEPRASTLPPPLPSMTLFPPSPSSSVSSVGTYDSLLSRDDGAPADDDDAQDRYCDAAPLVLPATYRPPAGAPPDPTLRPSDPYTFGRLFPSLDRLAVRHDDGSPDGNMNLRVETVVAPASASSSAAAASGYGPVLGLRRRPATVQLFHLRMHNLARRDFSLRRYCRDSGREVCVCKREYTSVSSSSSSSSSASAPGSSGFHRSVSAALRSVKTPFRRSSSSSSSSASSCAGSSAASARSTSSVASRRPSTTSHRRESTDSAGSASRLSVASTLAAPPSATLLVPTDTIKLEFSNYARVDVRRRGRRRSGRYEFDWWGHSYAWRRAVDATLGSVSFHLVRDGRADEPVAHVVPDVRSPSQVEAEEQAGGWVPPCYMWISDRSVVEAVTDVADVIVATGLMALVDDCIRTRWQQAAKPAGPPFAARRHDDDASAEAERSPRSALRGFFSRRPSAQESHSPLRMGRTVAVC